MVDRKQIPIYVVTVHWKEKPAALSILSMGAKNSIIGLPRATPLPRVSAFCPLQGNIRQAILRPPFSRYCELYLLYLLLLLTYVCVSLMDVHIASFTCMRACGCTRVSNYCVGCGFHMKSKRKRMRVGDDWLFSVT